MSSAGTSRPDNTGVVPLGVPGLDDVLGGGFTPRRIYLVEGAPGSGKTTLALQFLREGVRRGEPVLHVSLSETKEELESIAASHGFKLDGITVRELLPSEQGLEMDEQYTMFHPSEVELAETTKALLADADRVRPTRVVIDSLSELRLLAGSALRFRRQILMIKQSMVARGCTVLLVDDQAGPNENHNDAHTLAHGVIHLEQHHPEYGAERRRLRVMKYRGAQYRGGYHDFSIVRGGLEVFPRLVASEHRADAGRERLRTGLPEMDAILGGGIERGTSTLIMGAAGTGKSSLAAQVVAAAAADGHDAAMFLFDESIQMLLRRSTGLGIRLAEHMKSGRVTVQQIDPAELSPGQFVNAIRTAVEQRDAAVVVIDSLNGYLSAMPDEQYLTVQLHELLTYLGHLGVVTILVGTQQGLIGQMQTTVDASYLADSVVLMRYFESRGSVHQAISVIKKRGGEHERTIRELRLESGGIRVGEPLRSFTGILTGVPRYDGDAPLMTPGHEPKPR